MLFKYIVPLVFSVLSQFSLAQTDFDNYRTLMSSGEIPKDFTITSKSKMEQDLAKSESQMSKQNKEAFYLGINYSIDEMLHSGDVVYGDPISRYVEEIVDRLLKDDADLRAKLRIYTIKSNAANAFSTDQGILFVTTGLVAQVSSEAQLAYILAHEISHYTHKHVIEGFDWKMNKRNHDFQVDKLSNYSKDKEFEADRSGLSLYNKAGYPLASVFETFDVLMYSYLPFDEVEVPKNYFTSSQMFIPENLFPTEKYPIKAEEDYDDSLSTHPNIKKRKEAIEAAVGEFASWGESNYYFSENRFLEIRNIARFESIRTDILNANFGDALYSVFLLEREFPSSTYLKRMKSQLWLSFLNYKLHNKVNSVVDKNRELEGESAAIHYFLKKMSREGLVTLALRQIYDLQKSNPENEELKAIYKRCVHDLAFTEKFDLSIYSSMNFEQAAQDFELHKADTLNKSIADTVKKESGNKYQKIKQKKNSNNANNFDSSKYYLYGLSDLISDSTFIKSYKEEKKKFEVLEQEKEDYKNLSRRDKKSTQKENQANALRLGLNEVIVVEPKVFSSRGKKGFDPMKSEEIENKYSESIEEIGDDVGVKVYPIDRRNLEKGGTVAFNERTVLISYLSQLANDDDINTFPIDYGLLKQIQNNYGTSKVMFTIVEHYHDVNIRWGWLASSLIIFPITPIIASIHIPIAVFKANNTEMTVLVLDLEKGTISMGANYNFNEPVRKLNLGAHIYDIFTTMKQTKK